MHFKPTFLYIKEHKITGLLYFGKTTKHPEKYLGSGLIWKRHLKKHGTDHNTIWWCLFTDKEECMNFATNFSKINNIVESDLWANLIDENGLDGAPVGHPSFVTDKEEVARKISEASKLNWNNPEFASKVKNSQKKSWTDERRL